MFWKRIESLEKKVNQLLNEHDALKFQLECPLKYKVGDSVGEYLIVEREYKSFSKYYKVYHKKGKKTFNLHEQELINLTNKNK